jgi:branched-chain amino acid aminotransferase
MSFIILNSELIPTSQAQLSIFDRGTLLADGLFETCRVENNKIVCFTAHLDRLRAGAKYFQIPIGYTDNQIYDQCQQLIANNCLSDTTAALRITLTRGNGLRGIAPPINPKPNLFISCTAYTTSSEPANLITAKHIWSKIPPLSSFKTTNYQDSIIARLEANKANVDDAIMCNRDGHIVCTTTANIFLWFGEQLITPAISAGALPGITRARFITKARKLGIDVKIRKIASYEIALCDAAFITNSLIRQQPIASINGRKLSTKPLIH